MEIGKETLRCLVHANRKKEADGINQKLEVTEHRKIGRTKLRRREMFYKKTRRRQEYREKKHKSREPED